MEKLSEQMKSDLEYTERNNMSIPKNDIKLYINRVVEIENEMEQLKIKNEMLNDCNQKYYQENKILKEKMNDYLKIACDSKGSCNCECHNCEIDEDSRILEENFNVVEGK